MTCDFMSFSTVSQSYQDDGRVIYVLFNSISVISEGWEDDSKRTSFMLKRFMPAVRIKLKTARSAGYCATMAPKTLPVNRA